jgi:hypothetical protein
MEDETKESLEKARALVREVIIDSSGSADKRLFEVERLLISLIVNC